MGERARPAGHVFLSYVREDSPAIDRLQEALEMAGFRVWRDTRDLWPGEDWRSRIRAAITDSALVFLACFSRASVARARSYQNDELTLAIDELRRRPIERPWLIPIRLDDCDIPDRDIGGGRTLGSLQRSDLFGAQAQTAARRLIMMIGQLLDPPALTSPAPRQDDQSTANWRIRHGQLGTGVTSKSQVSAGRRSILPACGGGTRRSPSATGSGWWTVPSRDWAGFSANSSSWTTASTPRPKSSPTTTWSPVSCWRCRSREATPGSASLTTDGWTFYGDSNHLAYWLGHSLPVIVVIVDDDGNAFWEQVTPATASETAKGFALKIPRSQPLDATARDKLLAVAGRSKGLAASLPDFYAVLPPAAVGALERAARH